MILFNKYRDAKDLNRVNRFCAKAWVSRNRRDGTVTVHFDLEDGLKSRIEMGTAEAVDLRKQLENCTSRIGDEGGGDDDTRSEGARSGHAFPGPPAVRPPRHGAEDSPMDGGDMPGWIV